ncbi:MAG: porin [Myxococcales bacterium]
MKTSLMTLALLCAVAAAAGAQENPPAKPAAETPATPEAGAPKGTSTKPSMVCTDGVCVETPKAKAAEKTSSVGYQPGTGLQYKSATDTVTLYGLLDITLGTADHVTPLPRDDRRIGFQTSYFSGDRWGIQGKHLFSTEGEKLGIAFRLESEYILNTGEMDTPNVLFNRDAWIGLESETLGQVHFGRQNTVARDFSGNFGDPYGSAEVRLSEGGWTNTNNFKQLIFYAGSVTGTRYDNGVVWKKKFGEYIIAGLGYQFGQAAGDFKKNSTQSAALGFNGKIVNISGFFTHANVNTFDHWSFAAGGNVILNPFIRLNGGYFHYWADQGAANGQRTDNAFTVSTKLSTGTPFDVELGYQVMKANNFGVDKNGYIPNPFKDLATTSKPTNGDKKTYYGAIFYRFDKRAETYFAADYMRLGGAYKLAVNSGTIDQLELALGLRFRF